MVHILLMCMDSFDEVMNHCRAICYVLYKILVIYCPVLSGTCRLVQFFFSNYKGLWRVGVGLMSVLVVNLNKELKIQVC
jgi:hypothetical protein